MSPVTASTPTTKYNSSATPGATRSDPTTPLWYYVKNITRPTVPSSGAANQGYLSAHYINDGKLADVVDADVPAC